MASDNGYSRAVNGLKVVLPLASLAILSTLFLLSDAPDPERALPYAEVDVAQLARELRLTQPRFAGVTPEGRELTLTARAASPDFQETNVIVTDAMEGRIALDDDAYLYLSSATGRIDVAERLAHLSGGVTVETTEGYRLISDAMRLHLAELGLAAPGRVEVTAPGITLTAGAMDLTGPEGAAVLSFTGGVRLLYEALE